MATQHAAFQATWLVFDHIIPWSRGGASAYDNLVVACQPCNCGRGCDTLDGVAMLHPMHTETIRSDWDGLERTTR